MATGSYLPPKILTNSELATMVDTSDEWITQRTGIQQRHIVEDDDVVSMGVKAAQQALQRANLEPQQIQMIIVATCTAPKTFPSAACLIQAALGIEFAPAFDIQAACSGFIYAMTCATKYIETNFVDNILVIGSEAMSKVVDWQDRSTCVLFGDGAGAIVLSKSASPGVISSKMFADGKNKDILYLNNALMSSDKLLRMEGRTVFKLAVKRLADVIQHELKDNNLTAADIDWVVPHQANLRILDSTARAINLDANKIIVTVDKHANTSGASIPLALDAGVSDGRIQRGQNLIFEAFGGGLTWGSALVRY